MPIFWDQDSKMPEIKIDEESIKKAERQNMRMKLDEESAARRNIKTAADKPFVANSEKIKVGLRDYFIAAALTGLCANRDAIWGKDSPAIVAKLARQIADEMLIERER